MTQRKPLTKYGCIVGMRCFDAYEAEEVDKIIAEKDAEIDKLDRLLREARGPRRIVDVCGKGGVE